MLITFEGIDGSGKSTQISILERRLIEQGQAVIVVREPGGTKLSERIRDILLQKRFSIAPFPELLLFSSARSQLVEEVIRPRLSDGFVVICDRFTDSTLAYQGGGRAAAPIDWLRRFNERVTGGLVPDRTYYLAMEPREAHRRSIGRRTDASDGDRMESSGPEFFQRVASTYEALAEEEPDRIVRIDGTAPVAEIAVRIWNDVERNRPPIDR